VSRFESSLRPGDNGMWRRNEHVMEELARLRRRKDYGKHVLKQQYGLL